MKTFDEYLVETSTVTYDYPEEMLTEANYTSNHRRTPTEMAIVYKNVLKSNGHTIVSHDTDGNGAHIITHVNPKKRVRVTTIKPVYTGFNKSEIQDRPGTPEEQVKHGPK
jgi:hypothetical protein